MRIERENMFNMRVTAEERAKLATLAKADDVTASVLLRQWIEQRYEARFGDSKPLVGPRRSPKRARERR